MKNGYNLAELLLTIGIIGIVAALTLPTLLRKHQRTVNLNQLKKVYNTFSNGFDLYMVKNKADNIIDAGMYSQDDLDEMIPKYFNIAEVCDEDNLESCMLTPNKYRKLNGALITYAEGSPYGYSRMYGSKAYLFADGSAARFRYSDGDIWILVDVNGKEGPNVQGKDVFTMTRKYNDNFTDWASFEHGCCDAGGEHNVGGCFGKILELSWHLDDSNYCPRHKY